MKNKYFIFIITILFLSLTGCNKKTICEKHGHDFLDATCLDAQICKNCNEETGTSLGHDLKKTESVKASCLVDGYDLYKCTRCDYTKKESFASIGHDLTEIVLRSTCTEKGMYTTKCINCDYQVDHDIPKQGHVEIVDKGYEATCTSKGLTDGIHCDICNEILKPQEEILELEHTYDNNHDDECNICGFTRDTDYIRVKDEMNLYLGVKLDDLMSLTQNYESIIICPDSLFYIFTVDDKYNVVVEYPIMAPDAAARIEVFYKPETTIEDYESIKKGMTVYEMVEIIGKPSDYSTTSSGSEHYVSYDVDTNTKFTVIFVEQLGELNLVNETRFYEK